MAALGWLVNLDFAASGQAAGVDIGSRYYINRMPLKAIERIVVSAWIFCF